MTMAWLGVIFMGTGRWFILGLELRVRDLVWTMCLVGVIWIVGRAVQDGITRLEGTDSSGA